ncbi:MAG TPA: hypothetical protein VD837_00615 [Terriglobales bacterium]|nr:hypothetical protein [Terriglobales bacterium]
MAGVIVAGLVGGYVMVIAGLWAGTVPGLVAVDIADFGRRYLVSDRPSAWFFGFASHLANSVLLVLVWAMLIEPNLGWSRAFEGFLWGEFLSLFLAGSLVAPMTGIGLLGWRTGNARFAVTSGILHAVWGVIIGFLY